MVTCGDDLSDSCKSSHAQRSRARVVGVAEHACRTRFKQKDRETGHRGTPSGQDRRLGGSLRNLSSGVRPTENFDGEAELRECASTRPYTR